MSILNRRRFLQTATTIAAGLVGRPAIAAPETAGAKPVKYKLGLVTYNVAKDWDLPSILSVCQKVGLDAVELRTTHKHGVEPSLSKDQRRDVRKRFADAGITCWGCGTTCEFHSPKTAEVLKQIEICKQFVALTADIGGKGVKVRPNGLPGDVPVPKTLEQIGKSLRECGKAAAGAGVEIFVEVHGKGTADPPHMKTIMEHCDMPKTVGVCWNSNKNDIKDGSVAEYFKLLRPWLLSCHINELENDAKGEYPYRELFRLLAATGYDRVTLCEYGKASPDPVAGEKFMRDYKALWTKLTQG
jgi:sugar phosphate isomerase/epimerase